MTTHPVLLLVTTLALLGMTGCRDQRPETALPPANSADKAPLAELQRTLGRHVEDYLALRKSLEAAKSKYEHELTDFVRQKALEGPESRPAEIFRQRPRYPADELQKNVQALHEARNRLSTSRTAFLRAAAEANPGKLPTDGSKTADDAYRLVMTHDSSIAEFFDTFPQPLPGR